MASLPVLFSIFSYTALAVMSVIYGFWGYLLVFSILFLVIYGIARSYFAGGRQNRVFAQRRADDGRIRRQIENEWNSQSGDLEDLR